MKPWEFERLTPGEFLRMVEGYNERRELEARDRIQCAWLTAALIRQKRLPKLERLIRPRGAARRDGSQARLDYEMLRATLG